MADWAAFDAAFSTVLSATTIIYAGIHALAALVWLGRSRVRWVLLTTLPLAAWLVVVWAAYERGDAPGWQLVLLALVAAALSLTRRRLLART